MSNRETVKLTAEQIAAIEKTLNHGERVELIPTKDGVKLIKVVRRNVKTEPSQK